jgi:hypothetical protein
LASKTSSIRRFEAFIFVSTHAASSDTSTASRRTSSDEAQTQLLDEGVGIFRTLSVDICSAADGAFDE